MGLANEESAALVPRKSTRLNNSIRKSDPRAAQSKRLPPCPSSDLLWNHAGFQCPLESRSSSRPFCGSISRAAPRLVDSLVSAYPSQERVQGLVRHHFVDSDRHIGDNATLATVAGRPGIGSDGRKGAKAGFRLFDPMDLSGLTGESSGFLPGDLGDAEILRRHHELDGRRIRKATCEDVDRTVKTGRLARFWPEAISVITTLQIA